MNSSSRRRGLASLREASPLFFPVRENSEARESTCGGRYRGVRSPRGIPVRQVARHFATGPSRASEAHFCSIERNFDRDCRRGTVAFASRSFWYFPDNLWLLAEGRRVIQRFSLIALRILIAVTILALTIPRGRKWRTAWSRYQPRSKRPSLMG